MAWVRSVMCLHAETRQCARPSSDLTPSQKSFQDLLWKQEGDRAMWEYPFAVAVKPRTLVGAIFTKFLAENKSAFDLLYCITFKLLDRRWLQMHASYMDFNSVMKGTHGQLEKELLLDNLTRLEDLPSYNFLTR